MNVHMHVRVRVRVHVRVCVDTLPYVRNELLGHLNIWRHVRDELLGT